MRAARAVATVATLTLLASCRMAPPSSAGTTRLLVVAVEDQWGSLAEQVGGAKVSVTNVISNPNADPHSYEPTAADARAFATANVVIENGIGYDPWADQLLSANPEPGRIVVNVGEVVGVPVGGNPHQWYSPTSVREVIAAIARAYQRADAEASAFYASQEKQLLNVGLAQYFGLIRSISQRYSGTPVGASEWVFAPMAPALGLRLVTPVGFLQAISQGTEPTAADLSAIEQQISSHQIEVYIYNSQNATPDVTRQVSDAAAAGIPVTTITETLVPAGASFQSWQVSQLQKLEAALSMATGH
jgi:zinc/manganese transport system substrate-binding protein